MSSKSSRGRKAQRVRTAAQFTGIRMIRGLCGTTIKEPQELERPRFRLQTSAKPCADEINEQGLKAHVGIDFRVDDIGLGDSESAIEIEAIFELSYSFPEEFSAAADEIQAWVESNGVFNAWPFAREFVHNSMTRMGLPPFFLPLYKLDPDEMAAGHPESATAAKDDRTSSQADSNVEAAGDE